MPRGELFAKVARAVARRPLVFIIAVLALAAGGAFLALRLDPSAGTDTLVDSSTEEFQATERFKDQFGDDAVAILVKGDLQRTMLTPDLGRLVRFEGCISGNVPKDGLGALPPQCAALAELKPARVVYGPGTFVNTAATQIANGFEARLAQVQQEGRKQAAVARAASKERGDPPAQQKRLGAAAQRLVQQNFEQEAVRLGLRYGITNPRPTISDPSFVSQLVFDTSKGPGVPKARFAYLFPGRDSALIQVRLRPDLTDAERSRTIELIKGAAADDVFKPERGARYVVSGVPVIIDGLADAVQRSILILLLAALVVMAGTLALVFRSRLRLLPLGIALAAAALTYGAVSLAGGTLTMASIAALPVLIGLAVDYAIQVQARYNEVREIGSTPPPPEVAAPTAAAVGAPTIAGAGLATAAGFLVLLLSPVPMVRGFGLILLLGVVLGFACALTAGLAVLVRYGGQRRQSEAPPLMPRARARVGDLWERVADSRAGVLVADSAWRVWAFFLRTFGRGLRAAIARPRQVLLIGLSVALVGWLADTQTEVISDVRELVPQDLQALKDVNELQAATGVAGEVDVTVRAADLTDPSVIAWMTKFQGEVLKANGFKRGDTCAQPKDPPDLCPALSLPDLFSTSQQNSQQSVRALLDAVPSYFSQAVITPDRRTANLAFGLRLMPLDQQKEVIDRIRSRLDPPAGVEATVVGLPVLASEANDALGSAPRRFLALGAGLLAVFLVLLLLRRRTSAAAVPLIPIALATGWSALVLFLLRIPLNPMSAALGALVIAISTEFSVLLSARYAEERRAGTAPGRALEVTYASTGAAVLASGATAIAGFAALIASDIRMLRDFGIVTVVDLTVSLLGVMVVLPAALIWAEEHGPFTLRDLDPRRWVRSLREILGDMPRPGRPRLPAMPRPRRPSFGKLRALRARPRAPRRRPWRRTRA